MRDTCTPPRSQSGSEAALLSLGYACLPGGATIRPPFLQLTGEGGVGGEWGALLCTLTICFWLSLQRSNIPPLGDGSGPRGASLARGLLDLYRSHLDCIVALSLPPFHQAVLALGCDPGCRDFSCNSLHTGRSRKNKRRFEGGEKRAAIA